MWRLHDSASLPGVALASIVCYTQGNGQYNAAQRVTLLVPLTRHYSHTDYRQTAAQSLRRDRPNFSWWVCRIRTRRLRLHAQASLDKVLGYQGLQALHRTDELAPTICLLSCRKLHLFELRVFTRKWIRPNASTAEQTHATAPVLFDSPGDLKLVPLAQL